MQDLTFVCVRAQLGSPTVNHSSVVLTSHLLSHRSRALGRNFLGMQTYFSKASTWHKGFACPLTRTGHNANFVLWGFCGEIQPSRRSFQQSLVQPSSALALFADLRRRLWLSVQTMCSSITQSVDLMTGQVWGTNPGHEW